MPSSFNSKNLDGGYVRLLSYPPHPIVVDRLLEPYSCRTLDEQFQPQFGRRGQAEQNRSAKQKHGIVDETLTLHESSREIDTHFSVPTGIAAWPLRRCRNSFRLDLLQTGQDALLGTEPHYDLGHTEKKRLDPEPEELALKICHVPLPADLYRGLKLNPIDGLPGGWAGVPY